MNFTPSDIKARHQFVDATIDRALEVYTNVPVLPRLQERYYDMLGELATNVIVPNIIDGEVRIPKSQRRAANALPMIAINPGERLSLGEDFLQPTARQKQQADKIMSRWEPHVTAEQIVNNILQHSEAQRTPVSITNNQSGKTSAQAVVIEVGEQLFEDPPTQLTLARFLCRPLVAVRITDSGTAEPDLLAHEFTHVLQKTENPFQAFTSQAEVDESNLRDELQAYYVGAHVRLDIEKQMNSKEDGDAINEQLMVEAVRHKYNSDNADAFEPQPQLITALKEFGLLDRMIHQRFDFDAVRDHLVSS